MKALLILLLPLVAGDLYKETQNFEYSRTGDEGEKKGFYGSQSGNMGGNYEVARNMDTLAQRQMKGLVQQVGAQLGIDPDNIGTGAIDRLGPGSVYGSASTRGTAFGVKEIGSESAADRYASESRRTGAQSYGTQQREYGSRTSGQRLAGSSYIDEQARHGSVDGIAGSSSQSGLRQTAGRQVGVAGSRYSSGGSRFQTASNVHNYEASQLGEAEAVQGAEYSAGSRYHAGGRARNYDAAHLGETGAIQGTDYQTNVYVPVTGVRQVGLDSMAAGTQYTGSGSRYQTGSSAYEQSQSRHAAEDSQISTGETVVRPIVVRPGHTVRLAVLPNQVVPIQIPVRARPVIIKPTYNPQNIDYGAADVTLDSASQTHQGRGETRNYGLGRNLYDQTVATDRVGSASKGYQSSYSYQKEWEKHGSTAGDSTVQLTPGVSTVGQVTDMGAVAQNRDRLLIAGVELGSAGQGSTVYNSGSRVAATGRRYGASQTHREASEDAQQTLGYNAGLSSQTSDEVYDTAANAHGRSDSETLGSRLYSTQTKPKSYQSSYSYQKSWEKHGTPYVIEPVSGSSASQNQYGQDLEAQRQDSSHTDAQGSVSSRYGENQRLSSSSRSRGAQYENSYDASHASTGASQTDALSVDMATLQERLKSQMAQMGQMGSGNTKGYRAQYSYSAQRSYGGTSRAGTHDPIPNQEQMDDHHRYKRRAYGGYGSSRHYHQYADPAEQLHQVNDRDLEELKKIIRELDTMRLTQPEDMGQQTEDLDQQSEDLGQQTQGFSESDLIYSSSRPSSKLQLGSTIHQDEDLGQQTEDLGQQTQGFSQSDLIYSPSRPSSNLQLGRTIHQNEDLGQQTEDLGQQTQGFSQSDLFYSSSRPSSNLQLGSTIHQNEDLGQQTEDLGQQTQGFSQSDLIYSPSRPSSNLQLGSTINQNEDLGQQTEDLGQQTQGFSQSDLIYSPSIPSSNLQLGSTIHQNEDLGQQTEDLGQQTQGFSQSDLIYSPSRPSSNLQLGSTIHQNEDLGQQTEDLGQQTQGFSQSDLIYSPSRPSSNLQLGSTIHQYEDLGQQTEDLGQQTQGFSQSDLIYSPSRPSSNLQLGSTIHQYEDLGQQTEDLGQQTQGFSQSDLIYSPSRPSSNLQLGSTIHQNEDLGQQTEDLGQQTEDLGQQTEDLGQQTEDLHKGKTQSNIEYDDNKHVELQIGSILQQNEYFGKQLGNLEPKPFISKPSETSQITQHNVGLETQHFTQPQTNTHYKPSTGNNIRLHNTFNEQNKLQNKTPGSYDHDKEEHKPKYEQFEDVDSHLAELLKTLGGSDFYNGGHNTESKLDNIQAQMNMPKQKEVSSNYANNLERQTVNNKEKASVDIEFDAHLGQETQQFAGWDEQTLMAGQEKETDQNVVHVTGLTKPNSLTAHSHLTSAQDILHEGQKENNQLFEDKSFLEAYPQHLDIEKEQTATNLGTTQDNDLNQRQVSVQPLPAAIIEQETDDGGQQTLETQWTPYSSDVQRATLKEGNNLQTLSSTTHDKNQQSEKINSIVLQQVNIEVTTTENPGFWKKVGSGIGRAKDKAKSWFG